MRKYIHVQTDGLIPCLGFIGQPHQWGYLRDDRSGTGAQSSGPFLRNLLGGAARAHRSTSRSGIEEGALTGREPVDLTGKYLGVFALIT